MTDQDLASEITLADLLFVGYSYAKVGRIRTGRKLGPTSFDSLGMVQRMQDFCRAVESERLGLSKSAKLATKLLQGRLAQLERAVENYPDADLYPETAKELRTELKILWDRVTDEASSQQVHVIQPNEWEVPFREFVDSPRGAFGLGPAYDPELPRELDENLEQAALHIEFQLMGGAIFFMLRAVEVVLKFYYTATTGKDTDRPWGCLCDSMDEPTCEVPAHLVSAIRQLKNAYRDPTMHVTDMELEWNGMTAVQVLSLCKALVASIMKHLERIGQIESLTASPTALKFNGG